MKVFKMFCLIVLMLFVCAHGFGQDLVVIGSDPVTDPSIPAWIVGVCGLVFAVIEYILGKTTWIKPNSILDVIFQVILKILGVFAKKEKRL